jgi:mitochondrial distribution and morphology protein 31
VKPPLITLEKPRLVSQDPEMAKPNVIVDIDLRFRDLKATIPIFTQDLSYVNNALIWPIIAFMKYVKSSISFFNVLKPKLGFLSAN